jgi:hypothetical protein
MNINVLNLQVEIKKSEKDYMGMKWEIWLDDKLYSEHMDLKSIFDDLQFYITTTLLNNKDI